LNGSVELLLAVPALTALICFFMPKGRWASVVSVLGSLGTAVAAAPLCYNAFGGTVTEYSVWYFDGLSALFVAVTASIALMVSLYSCGYIQKDVEDGRITSRDERSYFTIFHLFVLMMLLVFVVLTVNFLVDLAYLALDPRLRQEAA